MRMNRVLVLLVAVIACTLLLSSCTKKPKIDLSGVARNPSVAGTKTPGGASFGDDGLFVAGPTDLGEIGGDGALDGVGPWDATDKPVAAGAGNDFLKNAERWEGVVYFGYDQSDIVASERAKLDTLAVYLNENPGLGVVIEGHTDDRGSDEYNRALGERRALSVQQYLGLLGVADARMQTLSYGEDKPAVQNAVTDAGHQRNRRAEFVIGDL